MLSPGTKALARWEERKEEAAVEFHGILAVWLGDSEQCWSNSRFLAWEADEGTMFLPWLRKLV